MSRHIVGCVWFTCVNLVVFVCIVVAAMATCYRVLIFSGSGVFVSVVISCGTASFDSKQCIVGRSGIGTRYPFVGSDYWSQS